MKFFVLFFRALRSAHRDHHPGRIVPAGPPFWILHAR